MEAILITSAEPPLNRQGGRWGSQCEQYLQVPYTSSEGLEDTVAELSEAVLEMQASLNALLKRAPT